MKKKPDKTQSVVQKTSRPAHRQSILGQGQTDSDQGGCAPLLQALYSFSFLNIFIF